MDHKNLKIEIENVSMIFDSHSGEKVEVLNNASMKIKNKEFVAIIGSSGCGKSTIINLVAGLQLPTSGNILMNSSIINGKPHRSRGVVFQQDVIFPWRTVIKNVEYGLELRGVSNEKRRSIAKKYLSVVGLEHAADFFPKELSGGMRKRVQIAAIFANDPEVLLMDEPFGSLDYPTKVNLQSVLLKLWKKSKKTTIFVTHDLEEAIYLADRILAIENNKIVEVLQIPFPRPRENELRNSIEFIKIKSKLWRYVVSSKNGSNTKEEKESDIL
jgi:NitT/TauT family transport system ATP-binding protein